MIKKTTRSIFIFIVAMSVAFFCALPSQIFAQTNPAAQSLPYGTQNFSSFTGTTTTYPVGIQGWTITGSLATSYPTTAPAADQALLASGTNATTTAGVYDFTGKIGLISTGSNMRTICLAVNTTGQTNIQVSYLAQTQAQISAGRIDELGMQYRIGTSGTFTNLTGSTYQNNATSTISTGTTGSNPATVTFILPAACENVANLQLRWLMRDVSGSGNRPTFSVDDISVQAVAPTPSLTCSAASITGFITSAGLSSDSKTYTITGANLTANATITAPANFEVSSDNVSFSNSISLTQSSGTLVGQPVTVYVRIKSSAPAGTLSAVNVTNATTGATTQNVAVSGFVYTAAVPFTAGNIVIERLGDGSASPGSSGTPAFLLEYTPAGTLVQQILLPTTVNGANRILTNSGSATSEGYLTRSLDGQYLIMAGYDAPVGTASVASAAGFNRIVGRVNFNGVVNTTTKVTDGYTLNNIRGACSIDGTSFWTSGAGAAADGGARYITLGATTSTQLSSAPTNARVINIFSNQLYTTAQSTPNIGVNTIGSGVPTTSGQTTVNVIPPTDNYGFVVLDRDATVAGPDCIYVCNNAGGLLKYSFNGTTWTARGSLTGSTLQLMGAVNGANADLYVIVGSGAGNQLYKVTDNTLFNANIVGNGTAITATGTLVTTAVANTVIRGVAFAPQALAGTPSVAVSAPGPSAGAVLQGTTDNVLYELQLTPSVAQGILTNLTLTTAGTYVATDFVNNSFKLRYSTDATLDATDPVIGFSSIVTSGSTMTFNVAQVIANGSTGYFFLTGDIYSAAVIGHTFNITSTSLPNIVLADAATKTGSAPAGGLKTIASSILPTVFYSNGGDLNVLSNWGDQTDGSVFVSGPTNFTTNSYVFNVANGSNSIGANWTVSGTNAKVVVPSGETFNVPAGFSFTGTVDVQDGGTLNLHNTTIPTFGTLGTNSNVVFAGTSGTQLIPGATYGNLKFTGAGTKNIQGVFNSTPVNVMGDLVYDNTTMDRSLTTFQNINFNKNLTIVNGITYTAGYAKYVNIEARGGVNQQVIGNGFDVKAGRFYINIDNNGNATALKTGGSVSLSNVGGSTNLVLDDDIKLNCSGSVTFDDGGNTISAGGDIEMKGTAVNYSITGTVTLTNTTAGNNASIRSDAITSGMIVPALNNLTINTSTGLTNIYPSTGSATLVLNGTLTIGGTSTGKLTPFGNTIQLKKNFVDTRTIDMIAAGTSTFEFNGSAAQTFTTAFTTGESFFNVKINNTAGVNMLTGSNFKITGTGNLNMTSGTLNTGSGKVILNNTATITEPVNGSSFVFGKVETVRSLTIGTNETFGGMGVEVNASAGTPLTNITLDRVIGNTASIGCANSSTLRYYDFQSAAITGLNATIVYRYFDTNYEMNNYDEGDVSVFRSVNNGTSWTTSTATLDSNNNKLTLTSQNALGRLTLSVAAPNGGNAIPAGGTVANRTTLLCSGSSTSITISGFGQGTVQWQQSSNGTTGWVNVSGGSGATSLTYNTPALTVNTFYRAIVSNSCFDISSTTASIFIATPLSVTITQVTNNSALVSWAPYSANSGVNYTVSWSGPAGTGSQSNAINPKLITGLTAGQLLNVTVTQNTPAGCINSGNASTTTLCAPVTSLTQTATTNNSISISWTGSASQYKVYWKLNGNPSTTYNSVIVSATAYTISGLYPNSLYSIYVSSYNCPTLSQSGQPTSVQFYSTTGTSACTVPTVSVSSGCPNSLTVTLSGSPTGQYIVSLRRIYPTLNSGVSYQVNSPTYTYTFNPNSLGTVCEVWARCICSPGIYSNESVPVSVQCKPACPAISNVVLSHVGCYGFTASWNADNCNGIGAGYYVYVKNILGNSWSAYYAANNNLSFGIFNPGSTIQVYVKALGCNAAGIASSIEQITLLSSCKDESEVSSGDESSSQSSEKVYQISNELSLYPNPNIGSFMVNYISSNKELHTVEVEVMNVIGQTLETNIIEMDGGILSQQVQLSNELSSGIYFVRVIDGGERMEKKFIIQK